jgi:hypothetical protein
MLVLVLLIIRWLLSLLCSRGQLIHSICWQPCNSHSWLIPGQEPMIISSKQCRIILKLANKKRRKGIAGICGCSGKASQFEDWKSDSTKDTTTILSKLDDICPKYGKAAVKCRRVKPATSASVVAWRCTVLWLDGCQPHAQSCSASRQWDLREGKSRNAKSGFGPEYVCWIRVITNYVAANRY